MRQGSRLGTAKCGDQMLFASSYLHRFAYLFRITIYQYMHVYLGIYWFIRPYAYFLGDGGDGLGN